MICFRFTLLAIAALFLVFATLFSVKPYAQGYGVVANRLLESTFSDDQSKVSVVIVLEIAPGGTSGRHTHLGDCYGTVIDGTLELRVDGRAPLRVSAGEAYHNPRGTVHELRNVSDTPIRVVTTLVVDEGKPIVQSVSQ